jgi:hypothetical protein
MGMLCQLTGSYTVSEYPTTQQELVNEQVPVCANEHGAFSQDVTT